jgi:hypothetical protein
MDSNDLHELHAQLGTINSDPLPELEKAYRKWARENHPDKKPGNGELFSKVKKLFEERRNEFGKSPDAELQDRIDAIKFKAEINSTIQKMGEDLQQLFEQVKSNLNQANIANIDQGINNIQSEIDKFIRARHDTKDSRDNVEHDWEYQARNKIDEWVNRNGAFDNKLEALNVFAELKKDGKFQSILSEATSPDDLKKELEKYAPLLDEKLDNWWKEKGFTPKSKEQQAEEQRQEEERLKQEAEREAAQRKEEERLKQEAEAEQQRQEAQQKLKELDKSFKKDVSGAFKDFIKSNNAQEYYTEMADMCRKAMLASAAGKGEYQDIEKRAEYFKDCLLKITTSLPEFLGELVAKKKDAAKENENPETKKSYACSSRTDKLYENFVETKNGVDVLKSEFKKFATENGYQVSVDPINKKVIFSDGIDPRKDITVEKHIVSAYTPDTEAMNRMIAIYLLSPAAMVSKAHRVTAGISHDQEKFEKVLATQLIEKGKLDSMINGRSVTDVLNNVPKKAPEGPASVLKDEQKEEPSEPERSSPRPK